MEQPEARDDERSNSADSGPERAGAQNPGPQNPGAQNPGADAGATANLSLKEQLEAARAERDSNYDLYLRSQAELQNYRKRVQKEWDDLRTYQSLPLARELLPALDNLYRAIEVAERSKNIDELVQGVRMVAQQIEAALARHDVVPVEAEGKPFDPNVHQAIQQVPTSEHPPMTVLKQVERGFMLKDRVVRPATVVVSAAAKERDPSHASDSSNSGDLNADV
jgi:molecular chaperone GrpE